MSTLQSCRLENIPGTPGSNGAPGTNGAAGGNAYAALAAGFTMPAYGGTGTANLTNTDFLAIGEPVFIETLGVLIVQSITDPNVVLLNPADGALAYTDNAVPGTIAPPTALVTPSGIQGPGGAISGVAGGDLTGNYPNPSLKNTGTAGTYGDATNVPRITTDAAGRVTAVTSTPITFPTPSGAAGGDLTGTYPNPTLAASGVAAATYGSEERIPAITLDAKGRATTAVNKQPRYGILGKLTSVHVDVAGDTPITINSTKYIVRRIIIESASINLTTATAGVFYGASTVAADQALSACSASTKFFDLVLSSVALTDVLSLGLTFRVGTPQGAAAIVNVWVEGEHLA